MRLVYRTEPCCYSKEPNGTIAFSRYLANNAKVKKLATLRMGYPQTIIDGGNCDFGADWLKKTRVTTVASSSSPQSGERLRRV